MKQINLPLMVQDPLSSQTHKGPIFEGYHAKREFFLDGPISKRVAILDFDPKSGNLVPGTKYIKGKKIGWYEDHNGVNIRKYAPHDIYQSSFMQASTFAAVLKTLDLFEKEEAMGRRLSWAFNAPQLFVIPRAGMQANAYYHRDTHSLQFFYFPSEKEPGKTIYSCLSRDIIAHETAHAIVDGIAPDLIDSATPQSLALHEALADIVAVLMAFTSNTLRLRVLEETDGSIKDLSQFTSIAEEFGHARGHRSGLRNLLNESNLNPGDRENCVSRFEPHILSEVLSGALYRVMIKIHDDLVAKYAKRKQYASKENPSFSASGYALAKGAERFKRMVFRALDYLPPGCISFLDFGRAMIAVDEVAFPENHQMRTWLRDEFERRHIATDKASLQLHHDYDLPVFQSIDIQTLYESDWVAYELVNDHRQFFGIPNDVPFKVLPRLRVCKEYDYKRYVPECIFKVTWDQEEESPNYPGIPKKRKITVGSTLVLDWDTGKQLVLLTNARPPKVYDQLGRGVDQTKEIMTRRQKEYIQQKIDRDKFIVSLIEEGLLQIGPPITGPDGGSYQNTVRAEVSNGFMRLKGTMNMLHIAEVE